MNHFAAYHNPDTMGYGALDINVHSQLTGQRIADPTRFIGARLWTVTGERLAGSPRKHYSLRNTFVIDRISPYTGAVQGFDKMVTGSDGMMFNPMIPLSDLDWFPEFLKRMGNFGFGIHPIMNSEYIAALQAITRA
ncbi:hypothetical protein [Ramlibacter sp. WS9]|uniref:hypothetical protein n=1 Tax=Ramlibacter sp. WS9 TaxID=1882741 RepID=UPI0011429004|nr:hypothetical protein [Ramlibacter sp. WS9]ROZ72091.1 hypothetical protein EEB15_20140 [Ramlibacter sp. WS9]